MENLIPRVQAGVDDCGVTAALSDTLDNYHSVQFRERFPGQVEHCMRLVAERLQTCLKTKNRDVISESDIHQLSRSLEILHTIHIRLQC
jgi:hypothetical protein